MTDKDIQASYEQACVVRTMETAGDLPRILYRCKACAALVEGNHRAAHRYWHLELTGEK